MPPRPPLVLDTLIARLLPGLMIVAMAAWIGVAIALSFFITGAC